MQFLCLVLRRECYHFYGGTKLFKNLKTKTHLQIFTLFLNSSNFTKGHKPSLYYIRRTKLFKNLKTKIHLWIFTVFLNPSNLTMDHKPSWYYTRGTKLFKSLKTKIHLQIFTVFVSNFIQPNNGSKNLLCIIYGGLNYLKILRLKYAYGLKFVTVFLNSSNLTMDHKPSLYYIRGTQLFKKSQNYTYGFSMCSKFIQPNYGS